MRGWIGRQYHRIRKRRCPRNIALPNIPTQSFQEVDNPYQADYDNSPNSELRKNLPVVKLDYRSDRFIGLFGRTVHAANLRCHQYLWVWNSQFFPPHAMDYAPATVYTELGQGMPHYISYDKSHYRPGWFKSNDQEYVKFWHNPLWNSFFLPSAGRDRFGVDEPPLSPLCDILLRRWWGDDREMEIWYGRDNDDTPNLKIKENLRNPMRQLAPDFNNFSKESPARIPTLEKAAIQISHLFALSSMASETLLDCIGTLQQLIRPAITADPSFARKSVAGLGAYLVLLHVQGDIQLEENERPWRQLLRFVDENTPKGAGVIQRITAKDELHQNVVGVEPKARDDQYYMELKRAIKWNDSLDVIREDVYRWWRRYKRYLTGSYREKLHEEIVTLDVLKRV